MFNLTQEDKDLLMCAFEYGNFECVGCSLSGRCSSIDEGNGFYNLGVELLKKLGIITDDNIKKENDFAATELCPCGSGKVIAYCGCE